MNLSYPLEEGSTGNNVTILQQKLKILGYYTPTITGSFGPDTTFAVRWFQQDNNLPITGIVDNETWSTIFTLTPSPFPTQKAIKPVLQLDSSGEYVKSLQDDLTQLMFYNGPISGTFDVQTENAVKAFQANNRITADGIVGQDTWSALTYLYTPLAICGGINSGNNNNYVVKKGDTLYSIAKAYKTTPDEIKIANNLNSDVLQIGQQLIIPSNTNEQSYINYIVQKGDTLYSISNRYNITINDILKLNNINSTNLSIGKQLKIPNNNVSNTYTVKIGDTLYSISKNYNTTANKIIQLNNLTSNALQIGQQLKIK